MLRMVIFFVSTALVISGFCNDDFERFKNIAQNKWAYHKNTYLKNSAAFETRFCQYITGINDGKIVGEFIVESVSQNDSNGNSIITKLSDSGAELEKQLDNERYVATIRKTDSGWALVSTRHREEPELKNRKLFHGVRINDEYVGDFLTRPEFRVLEFELNENEAVLQFEMTDYLDASGEKVFPKAGVITFDLRHNMLISSISLTKPGLFDERYVYETFSSDWSVPITFERTVSDHEGYLYEKVRHTYSYMEAPKDVENDEFYLNHYGLPEPDWAQPRSFPWFLVAAAVSCGVIALGYFIIRKSRE